MRLGALIAGLGLPVLGCGNVKESKSAGAGAGTDTAIPPATAPAAKTAGTVEDAGTATSQPSAVATSPLAATATSSQVSTWTVDPSFGSGGKIPVPDTAIVSVRGSGKIVLISSTTSGGNSAALVSQLNADGSADTTFGTQGTATLSFGAGFSQLSLLGAQDDGKLLISEYNGAVGTVVKRLTATGQADASFGASGSLVLPGNPASTVLKDNSIVSGFFRDTVASLIHYTRDGGATTPIALAAPIPQDFGPSQQSDGKLVYPSGGGLVRVNPDGSADSTYQTPTLPGATSVIFQSDGKGLVGTQGTQVTLLRLNVDGSLDTTFGVAGTAVVPLTNARATAVSGILPLSNGKILVNSLDFVGPADGPLQEMGLLTQLNADGSQDLTFGKNGQLAWLAASGSSAASEDAGYGYVRGLTADGKVLLSDFITSSLIRMIPGTKTVAVASPLPAAATTPAKFPETLSDLAAFTNANIASLKVGGTLKLSDFIKALPGPLHINATRSTLSAQPAGTMPPGGTGVIYPRVFFASPGGNLILSIGPNNTDLEIGLFDPAGGPTQLGTLAFPLKNNGSPGLTSQSFSVPAPTCNGCHQVSPSFSLRPTTGSNEAIASIPACSAEATADACAIYAYILAQKSAVPYQFATSTPCLGPCTSP